MLNFSSILAAFKCGGSLRSAMTKVFKPVSISMVDDFIVVHNCGPFTLYDLCITYEPDDAIYDLGNSAPIHKFMSGAKKRMRITRVIGNSDVAIIKCNYKLGIFKLCSKKQIFFD